MTLLGGRYRLERLIGSGGSADVHAAVDELLDRPVAVKIARAVGGEVADAGVRAAARLRHPRIAAILDAGRTVDGRPFLVLELVDGMTLDAMLDRAGTPSTHDALTIVGAVLDALDHAHRHGVLHLDLSPSNVMVAAVNGEPQPSEAFLLDLAGSRSPTPGDQTVTVSPEYAAPEIATATAADERSDVYSAGALLYLLLTGHPPFERSDPAEVLQAQVTETAPRPSELAPAVPAAVDRIVARALAKDPGARFGSALAMRAAVGDARSVLPRPTTQHAVRAVASPSTTKRLPVVAARAATPSPVIVARRSAVPLVAAVLVGSAVVGGLALLRPSVDDAQGADIVVTATTTSAPAPSPTETETPGPPPTQEPDNIAIPVLTGLDLDAAQAALAAAGLLLEVTSEVDAPVPGRTVLSVDPAEGTRIVAGATVRVSVASGFTAVPTVLGATQETVDGALVVAGLVRDSAPLAEVEMGVPAGTVLRAVPPAGTRVPVGTPVRLVLAAHAPTPTPTPTAGPTPSPTPTPTPPPTPAPAPVP